MTCGEPLNPGAQFCSRCGTPVVAAAPVQPEPVQPPIVKPTAAARTVLVPGPGPTPTPVASKRSTWWILPLVIVGLIVVAWLLLAGLPFGGGERTEVRQTATAETIAEGTAESRPVENGTVIEVEGPGEEPFATETAPQPPLATSTVAVPPVTQTVTQTTTPPPATQTVAPPRTTPAPPRTTTTAPAPRPTPAPKPAPPASNDREITDAEAAAVLRGYLASANPYDVRGGCLQIRSMGYSNVGYTYSVWDSCVAGGGTRMLGRWRVDSKNRDVFRQREDGRYLRP